MLGTSQLALRWVTTGERPTTAFDRTPGPMFSTRRCAQDEAAVKEIAMTDQYFNAPLSEVDPEIAQVL